MKPVPTDPDLKISLIRFLGSDSFHQTRDQSVDKIRLAHSFAAPQALQQILWTILGLGNGKFACMTSNFFQLIAPLWLRRLSQYRHAFLV